jgi:ligand-binding SRPBCC domain-containing protein
MTFPASLSSLSDDWQPGRRLFRSWILLFGLLPVDYDDLTLVEVEEGRRFLERSEMMTQKLWQHEREFVEITNGVRIIDRVSFCSRVSALEPIQLAVFRSIFKYRHFRLRRLFGHDAA